MYVLCWLKYLWVLKYIMISFWINIYLDTNANVAACTLKVHGTLPLFVIFHSFYAYFLHNTSYGKWWARKYPRTAVLQNIYLYIMQGNATWEKGELDFVVKRNLYVLYIQVFLHCNHVQVILSSSIETKNIKINLSVIFCKIQNYSFSTLRFRLG